MAPPVTQERADAILGPHRATWQDAVLWAGVLLVALLGAAALFGGTVRDLIMGTGGAGVPSAEVPTLRSNPGPH